MAAEYIYTQGYLKGGCYAFNPPPLRNYDEKNLMCPSVSVFHKSVQWSFDVDQFMQTCEQLID